MRVGAMTASASVRSPSNGAFRSGLRALDDLAHQRVAVGVRAVRGQPQHHVARRDRLAVDDARFLDDADGEAGQIVFAVRIHARHFGGLAADQRAAGQFAALGDALDHRGRGVDIELAAGEVIEEEQRLGALHQNVIDAHRHQVLADGVVAVQLEGELELGADAVGAGNQHRLAIALRAPRTARRSRRCRPALRGAWCAWRSGLMRSTSASPASMSTPAAA